MKRCRNSTILRLIGIVWVGLACSTNGYSEWTDPTAPFTIGDAIELESEPEQEVVGHELTQILIAKERKIAVINGEIVKEGDTIQGAKVIKIAPGQVKIIKKGKVSNLSLLPNEVKSSVK